MTLKLSRDVFFDSAQSSRIAPVISESGRIKNTRGALRSTYLAAMRQVACSVAVVTTDGPAGRHGATVSAFCSVSADPPTVLVCLRSDSRIRDMVTRNGVFTLNILPEDDRDIARAFTGEFDAIRADRFEGVVLAEHPGFAPGIAGATTFVCELARADVQCSHTICIGEVAHISSSGRPPLTYHDGAYRNLRGEPEHSRA